MFGDDMNYLIKVTKVLSSKAKSLSSTAHFPLTCQITA